jgi:1-acyl-sn-glycerol-3-phosphate acyltransferase
MRHLVKAGRAAAAEGRQIVIFPEGTRVPPGQRVPLQPGVAALATATGLPVVPVATDSGYCWGRRAFRKLPGTITIRVRPAIPPGLHRVALLQALVEAIELEPAPAPPDASHPAQAHPSQAHPPQARPAQP